MTQAGTLAVAGSATARMAAKGRFASLATRAMARLSISTANAPLLPRSASLASGSTIAVGIESKGPT